MGKGRAPCCDKSKVKRGPWSTEEDLRLVGFIQKNGHSNWRALPKQAGLLRCGKSCRLRWINYLRPDVKRGNFTPEEEQTIINLHNSIGNKWSKIASYLPGRTDNEIKNVWNTHLKKRLTRKNNNTKSDSQKNGADDSKMDYSASPSCTSSSITVSGSDPNMEKEQIDRDFQESEIKKTDEITEPKETTNSNSGQNQKAGFSKSAVINDQENYIGDENIEIPFDSDINLWELLDSLDPLQEQSGEIQGSNLEKFDCEVECNEWLRFLEDELGLTTDNDNLPNQKHLEMDLEPEIGHELDFIPTLNGSSENFCI